MERSETPAITSHVIAFVKFQSAETLIIAGAIVFTLIVVGVVKSRQPAFEHEDKKLESELFLKIYPLCVFACWAAIVAGLVLVGMGVAAHLNYIDIGGMFDGAMHPLELALYACAMPFGAAMGLWRFTDLKKAAQARVTARKAAAAKAGPIRSY